MCNTCDESAEVFSFLSTIWIPLLTNLIRVILQAKQDDGPIPVDSSVNRPEASHSNTSYSSVSVALAVTAVGLIFLVLVSFMTRKGFRGEAKSA